MADEQLTIGALATSTGVATSALRYWEELGLLPAPARSSGQRRYPAATARLVGMILMLRDVGFTLREIKQLLAARTDNLDTWQELYRRKLAELDERISQAQIARTALAHGLDCPHDGPVFDCPTFNSVLARHMAGQSLAEAHTHPADREAHGVSRECEQPVHSVN